jgi:nitrogen regulatory protein PII
MEDKIKYELILVIVNDGFADSVMDAARIEGARGGTVISARGTAKEEMLSRFKVFMTPEKEIVLIVADKKIKEKILKSIYSKCGLNSEAHGIAFTLPIDETVGLNTKPLIDVNNIEK